MGTGTTGDMADTGAKHEVVSRGRRHSNADRGSSIEANGVVRKTEGQGGCNMVPRVDSIAAKAGSGHRVWRREALPIPEG